MNLTSEQLKIIHSQLGREPRGIVRIAVQSKSCIPQVLQMRSLMDDAPFPTLYWLCSKKLCKAIGQIEGQGVLKLLELRLQQDAAFLKAYLADQKRYVARRWELMLPSDKQRIEKLGFTTLFHKYGIGGITAWDKIRCLHMQYAYHLAEGGVIGTWLDAEYNLIEIAKNEVEMDF